MGAADGGGSHPERCGEFGGQAVGQAAAVEQPIEPGSLSRAQRRHQQP
jgi:hypothetical protein